MAIIVVIRLTMIIKGPDDPTRIALPESKERVEHGRNRT